ncbi:MAG TPA: type II secretion system protein [bacterium]|nr:type II secretion system protein [bacterium]
MKRRGRRSRGFTLLEVMIVAAVIGILAAVVFPLYKDMLEKANLGASLANLGTMRSALNIYYGSTFEFPANIDYEAQDYFRLEGGMPSVKSRYPTETPPAGKDVTLAGAAGDVPAAAGTGWFYDPFKGFIYINSTAESILGKAYSTY